MENYKLRGIYSWTAPKLQVGGIGLHCSCLEILPSNLLWSQLGWCDSFTRKILGVKSIASLTKESDLIRKSRKYTQRQMEKSCSDPNQRLLCWLVQAAKEKTGQGDITNEISIEVLISSPHMLDWPEVCTYIHGRTELKLSTHPMLSRKLSTIAEETQGVWWKIKAGTNWKTAWTLNVLPKPHTDPLIKERNTTGSGYLDTTSDKSMIVQ